jgi:endoglucanase
MSGRARTILLAATLSSVAGCNNWTTPAASDMGMGMGSGGGSGGSAPEMIYPPDPANLHVVGNRVMDAAGDLLVLRGVNRSGTEYECAKNAGIFDGASDEASIAAMATWNVNAVRVPLNESCWLGINGANPLFSGQNYRTAILSYVNLLHKYKLTPILELHWTGAGTTLAKGQQPMPDVDHAPAFWADVANAFLDDTGVVFELFNEPFPDSNHDSDAAWACWRDGCVADTFQPADGSPSSFQAAGMQELVSAVRATGATQLILLGGVQFSNALTQWLAYKPADPLNNLAVAWHIYNFNSCSNAKCWSSVLSGAGSLGSQYPIVATEIGENDCGNSFINPLMQQLDASGTGYLAWSWNANAECLAAPDGNNNGGYPWPLITDYITATPTGPYAQAFKDHLATVKP